jgi:hypothetical protein
MPGSFIECDPKVMLRLGIKWHAGYKTPFTRQQYELAKFKNGTCVRKLWEDVAGDIHAVGELGTVLGSIGHPEVGACYFVEWDRLPRMPTLVIETKLEPA